VKKIFIFLLLLTVYTKAFSQVTADSNFVTVITATNWMPDGRSLLLNIVKFDKTRKMPPVNKGFTFSLADKKLEPMNFEGSSRAASPDGKTLVFVKQKGNNKGDIYIYDLAAKKETAIVVDTFNKFAPGWSPDGKKIVYNRESNGRGRYSTIEVCIVDIASKEIKQITQSGSHKSYNPVWAPEGDKIVYYFEKGDNRDQIYLTDANGSFHTNLINDTSVHSFYPSWIDKNTIAYTHSPNSIMTMNTDGSNKKKVEGLNSFQLRYNPVTKQAAYVTQQPDSKLMLFDWEKKTTTVLLDQEKLKGLL
jgi:Tol biopolymer transport system component